MYYVGVGASAGGLEAIEAFFENMPADTGMAFIVIQHLSPHFKSLMTELLSKRTKIPVHRIEDGMEVEANAIYMIPPRKNLSMFHGKLLLQDQDTEHSQGINLPIDIFLQSLAEDQKEKAIAVILSGTGSDGTRGVRRVKEVGGMVMVQSDESAKFDGMPRSAVDTGLADFVLPAEKMAEQLLSFIKHPYAQKQLNDTLLINNPIDSSHLTRIFALLREKHKVDFTYYKPSTILRRLERRMSVNQIHDLPDYARFMETYHQEINALYRELLIGVTSFFRDEEAFLLLKEKYIPELFEKATENELRFWVAGCSTGEEAYSLAIVCQEVMETLSGKYTIKIFATDIDKAALDKASNGIYPESIAADLSPKLLAKYFYRRDDNFHITRSLREMVVFAQHNIIKDPPFTNIDFVSCRNLLIYLQPILQKKALEYFNFALNPDKFLFLGSSETVGELGDSFQILEQKWRIYRSKGKRKLGGFATESIMSEPGIATPRLASPLHYPQKNERFLERFIQVFADEPNRLLAAVVNEQQQLVYTLCDKDKYLSAPIGRASNEITKMVDKELSIPLATGLQKLFKTHMEIRYSNIRLEKNGKGQNVQMRIKLLAGRKDQEVFAAVLVEKPSLNTLPEQNLEHYNIDKEIEQRMQDLEQELQFTKENLQATIEELETSNEELQATNEELLASNEELQSTNEELQSVNEELFTVNAEHQQKIMELTVLNNDIENLFNSTEIATLFIDENMELRRFTPNASQIFKIIDSDLGRPLSYVAHYMQNVDPLRITRHVMLNQQALEQEISTENGKTYLMRVLPYKIANDTYSGVVMTFTDITEITRSQQALRLNNERFMLAQDVASFGLWDWDIRSGKLKWTETIFPLFGRKETDSDLTYDDFLNYIHPDDRSDVQQAVENTLKSGESYRIEHRILWQDGKTTRWVMETGKVFYDDNSKPLRMLGIVQDIDELKRQQQELLLANGAFESQQPTSITDADGVILRANKSFEEFTGYSQDELIGQKHSILKSGRQDKSFYKAMWDKLIAGGHWEGVLYNKHKNGKIYLESLCINAVKDKTDTTIYYVGHFEKIEE